MLLVVEQHNVQYNIINVMECLEIKFRPDKANLPKLPKAHCLAIW